MKSLLFFCFIILLCSVATAQIDPTLLKRIPVDTTIGKMNMDALYNRPSLQMGKLPVSLGGYVEANWQHIATDGVSEGHQFQFRRLSIFIASSIAKRIKFLAEIEFEPAERSIEVEYAAMDVEFHPLLNLRAGMIVNPIGAFNQNHDGPKWEFTDRPIAAEQMLPATWSNAGGGLYGKYYKKKWMVGYELYLTGGFNNSIIDNNVNRTSLAAAKINPERFEESASGKALITGKVAIKHSDVGEIGISYMGGVYNKWQDDGLLLDRKRRCDVFAIDINSSLKHTATTIIGEWAWIIVNVPDNYTQQYGRRQMGGFIDIVQPVLKRRILGWEGAMLNVACRLEYVDWNVGHFKQTGRTIGEDIWSIMPSISFRPGSQTVFRLNYRFQKQHDLLNNLPATTGGFIFGIATYF